MNVKAIKHECTKLDRVRLVQTLPATVITAVLFVAILAAVEIMNLSFSYLLMTIIFAVFTGLIICLISTLIPLLAILLRTKERRLRGDIKRYNGSESQDPLVWLAKHIGSDYTQYSNLIIGGGWAVGPRGAIPLEQVSGVFSEGYATATGYVLRYCFGVVAIDRSGQMVHLDGIISTSRKEKVTFPIYCDTFDDIRDFYIELAHCHPGILNGSIHDFIRLQEQARNIPGGWKALIARNGDPKSYAEFINKAEEAAKSIDSVDVDELYRINASN